MDIVLLGLVAYAVIVTVGNVVNKYLRLPWMFTIVIFGMILATTGWFHPTLDSAGFALLSRLGMLLFLFTIGLDLDLNQVRHLGAHIVGGNILLTLVEGTVLGLFFYVLFPEFVGHSLLVAMVSGIAFGTVGEVVLLAILKEFHMENTRFGQLALGIGVFDDIFEILALATVIALPSFMGQSATAEAGRTAVSLILTLVGLIAATVLTRWLGKYTRGLLARLPAGSFVPPFAVLMISFAFMYAGSATFENMGVVAAIFGGIAVTQLVPPPMLKQVKGPIFFVANIFLGPFFFLNLGSKMSFTALVQYPLIIAAVVLISLGTRIAISYLLFKGLLGKRASVYMGIGLTSKFSTSVVTENLLMAGGLITPAFYSILMGAFIVLKPIIVGGFARGVAELADAQTRSPQEAQVGAQSAQVAGE